MNIRKRPTPVLVIAILHLVGGTLLLLSSACGAAMQGIAAGMQPGAGPGGPGMISQQQMQAELEKQIPGYTAVTYAQMGGDFLFGIVLVVAGIGLLSMQPWARLLSIIYAIFSILNHIFSLVYALAVVVPGTQAVLEKTFASDPNLKAALPGMGGMMSGLMVFGVVVGALFIVYPITVLIVLTRRSVVAAFRGELPEAEREPEDYWDEPQREPDQDVRRHNGGFTERK
jgi:hypothetical protein